MEHPQLLKGRTFGEPLFRTDGEVRDIAYAADGTLCSIEESGTLRRWDSLGRQTSSVEVSDLELHWRFAPGALRLASGGADVTLWDAESGEELERLPLKSWVTAIEFSRDRRLLAVGLDDGKIELLDAETFETLHSLDAHPGGVSTLAFHPDGTALASAGEDRSIKVWDTAGGRCTATLNGHPDRIPALAWHPKENWLASAGWDTSARVWDPPHPDPVMLLNSHSEQVITLAFSPRGGMLICADSDHKLHVWDDPRTAKVRHVLSGHRDDIECLAFSADGTRLASAGAGGVIHVWDPINGRHVAGSDSPHPHRVALVPTDPPKLASVTSSRLSLWDLETGGVSLPSPDTECVLAVAASPDGKLLATSGFTPDLHVWDAVTGSRVRSCPHTKGPIPLAAFSPDSRLVASASATDGLVWVWDLAKDEAVLVIPEAADSCTLEALAFHPNGKWVAVGGVDWLATGGSDGAVCLWDLESRDRVAALDGGVTCLAIHPNGKLLVGGSLNESVYLWNLDSPEDADEGELPNGQQQVTAVAFSPDGRWLVAAGDERVLRVWDVATTELVASRHLEAVAQSLCFSPDGTKLYTGDATTARTELDFAAFFA